MKNERGLDYLSIEELAADPVEQFGAWYEAAGRAGEAHPETCCLATASSDGRPSARMVLLKSYGGDGFVFYTNYTSRKADELEANPRAALAFHWPAAHRQVRVEGTVLRTSRELSESYFAGRAYESRLGAWASSQSSPLESRRELDDRFEELKRRWPDPADVPLPEFWGGYVIQPEAFEFWQEGPHRLHDRFRYSLADSGWQLTRLAP